MLDLDTFASPLTARNKRLKRELDATTHTQVDRPADGTS